ncbi:MAG: hypothetical protein M4579_005314 [Chaenotheca gracillima]|nr:MAG: hypothetical protein M4579_005314 [Chaenotheca gracillima]
MSPSKTFVDGETNGDMNGHLNGDMNGDLNYDGVDAIPKKTSSAPWKTQKTQKGLEVFDLAGKVFIVTGGGRGLGLTMAEAAVEAGATVYCLDRLPHPAVEFYEAQKRTTPEVGGALHYGRIDVRDDANLDEVISSIAATHQRLDGLIAAAGIQQVTSALDYRVDDICKMMDINYTGVFLAARAVAKQMIQYNCHGSLVLVASISGLIANRGLVSPVYNSSKAAVIQLARNLAMEWGKYGLRVNSLCPGHILTPMVKQNFEDDPSLQKIFENENMLGRLSEPEEFRGAGLFLLSNASSFMTGSSLVIDGGHTAW